MVIVQGPNQDICKHLKCTALQQKDSTTLTIDLVIYSFFKVDLQPINVNNKTENQTESIINFNVKNSNVKL